MEMKLDCRPLLLLFFYLGVGLFPAELKKVSLIVPQSDSCKFIQPGVSAVIWKAAEKTCVHLRQLI